MSLPIEPKAGSQAARVLACIMVKGFINQRIAINELGIVSLTARISDLRKLHWHIVGTRAKPTHMMTYRLEK